MVGYKVLKKPAATSKGNPSVEYQVFQQEGDPLKKTVRQVSFGSFSSLLVYLEDDCIYLRIEPFNAAYRFFDQLARLYFFLSNKLSQTKAVILVIVTETILSQVPHFESISR